jgi:hypothetical protein
MPYQSSSTRRRGAPLGNLNAVKTGFYSTRFKKSERSAIEKGNFTGLVEEIALLRLYIHRVVAESLQIDDFVCHLEVLRVLSLASSSLSRLLKIHTLMIESPDEEFQQLLERAVREVNQELEDGTFPSYVPPPRTLPSSDVPGSSDELEPLDPTDAP